MTDSPSPSLALPLSQRPTIDISVESARPWRQRIIDRNPCFLLSGVSMLVGCFLISREIHLTDPSTAGFVGMLVGLVVVLNIYEAAVIALGLWLSRSGTLVRDARHLLGLAVLLLIDSAFVYQETATADVWLGGLIAGIAGLLSIVKVMVITRGVGVRLSRAGLVSVGLSLLALYALPVVMRLIANDGFVPLQAMMGLWAVLGLVTAGYALPLHWAERVPARDLDHQQLQRLVRAGVIALPLVALMLHAMMGLWVYGNGFTPAFVSPIILGAGAVLLRQHAKLGGAKAATRALAILILAALIASVAPPSELTYSIEGPWPSVSPLRGSLLIGAGLMVWAWLLAGGLQVVCSAVVMLLATTLGHTPSSMVSNLIDALRWLRDLLPSNRLGWGMLAVLLAFGLLVLGGGMSWWRERAARDRARATARLTPTGD